MMEFKPNIFMQVLPDGIRQVISLPDGYENMKDNWEWIQKCGDSTFCAASVDVYEVILSEYCYQLHFNGKFKTEEYAKALLEYKEYTGKDCIINAGFYPRR